MLNSIQKLIYNSCEPKGQFYLDWFRYSLSLLPRVNPRAVDQAKKHTWWLPSTYRGCLIISADLELAWAWRYVKNTGDPKKMALQKARQTRENFLKFLALFDQYDIPVTWATVGHLFLEKCERQSGAPHPEITRLRYFTNEFWRYAEGDWFDSDPCSNCHEEPAWYAPDLIRSILSAKVKHEIACHTFSHIDCSNDNCPPEVMNSELAECQRLAAEYGFTLKSFVFPGNLYGNFSSLKRCGFSAYRFFNGYELDVPRQDELGLWQIPGGVCSEKPEGWPVDAWIRALRRCVDRALETRTVLHLWFHPSCDPTNIERVFPTLLKYITAHRNNLWLTTMSGLVDSLALGK